MVDRTKQLAFYFDQTKCMGCQTCVVACKDWNKLQPGTAKLRKLHVTEMGTFPNVSVFMTVFGCNHCANPACIEACPFEAIYKRPEDGIVVIDRDVCQGNGSCKSACPYDAPQFPDDEQEAPQLSLTTPTKGHKMVKCNMCIDRVAIGQKPACVAACLTRAIDFGTVEYIEEKYPDAQTVKNNGNLVGFPKDTANVAGNLTEAFRTTPSFYFKPRHI